MRNENFAMDVSLVFLLMSDNTGLVPAAGYAHKNEGLNGNSVHTFG